MVSHINNRLLPPMGFQSQMKRSAISGIVFGQDKPQSAAAETPAGKSRRGFLQALGLGALALTLKPSSVAAADAVPKDRDPKIKQILKPRIPADTVKWPRNVKVLAACGQDYTSKFTTTEPFYGYYTKALLDILRDNPNVPGLEESHAILEASGYTMPATKPGSDVPFLFGGAQMTNLIISHFLHFSLHPEDNALLPQLPPNPFAPAVPPVGPPLSPVVEAPAKPVAEIKDGDLALAYPPSTPRRLGSWQKGEKKERFALLLGQLVDGHEVNEKSSAFDKSIKYDLNNMKTALTDPKLYALPGDHVETRLNADHEDFLEGVLWLRRMLKEHPGAEAMIYYSGHGDTSTVGEKDKEGDPEGEICGPKVKETELRKWITDYLGSYLEPTDKRPESKLLMVLDKCHAGAMIARNDGPTKGPRLSSRIMAEQPSSIA